VIGAGADAVVAGGQVNADAARQVRLQRGELTRLETELTKLDKLLTENFPTYAELSSPRPVTADEVQKLLGVDEVLIQFAVLLLRH
jgi:hypothetical protein